jgi:hypothetical protein
MAQALEDFVIRKAPNAILDIVEESLEKTQSELFADLTADNATKIQHIAKELKKKNEELTLKGQRQIKRATTYGVDSDEDEEGGAYGKLDSDSEYEENQGKKRGEKGKKVEVSGASSSRSGRGNATKPASASASASAGRGRGSGSGTGSVRGRGRGSGNAKSTKNLSSSPMSPKPSKRSSYADEIEDDDSIMENTSMKKRSKFNLDTEEVDDAIEDNYKGSIFANKNKKTDVVSTLSQKSTNSNSNSKSSKQSTLQFGSLPLGGRTSNRLTGKEKISYDESWD